MNRPFLSLCSFAFLLYLSLSSIQLYAQEFLNNTPIVIQEDNFSPEKIMSIIKKNEKYFSDYEIRSLMDSVMRYNSELDLTIHKTIESRQQLVDIRQRLLQQRNYIKLNEQIAEANSNYSQILVDIKKNLEGIAYKGFYVCAIKNISPMDDPDHLIERAKATITPIAVEEILGYYIQSITELYRREGFDDQFYSYIREEISGKLEVETKFHHAINPAERIFWYACKVTVSPLSEKLQAKEVSAEDENTNILVINALKEIDVRGKLISLGIKRSLANDIESVAKKNRLDVENENKTIKAREESIIRSGQQKLAELAETIKSLQMQIDQAHISLKKIIEGNTNVTYNAKHMVESVDSADRYLLSKIKELIDYELELREQKLQAEWDRVIATPGSPRAAISNNIIELKNQFETNYGKIEQFIEIAELVNDDLSLSQGRKVTHRRNVDRMWVFVEPQTAGFKLHVVAHFKIIDGLTAKDNPTFADKVDLQPNDQSKDHKKDIPPALTKPTSPALEPMVIQVADKIIEMVGVNGGTFTMGCTAEQGSDCWSNENPVREVILDDFYIGKYEVSQTLWLAVMGTSSKPNNPSHFKGCDYCPVENVSWIEVQEFIKKLNELTGMSFRLPTEAEWEFAARGGIKSQQFKFSGSNTAVDVAWHYSNSKRKTQPIATTKPNELGIHDMSGNVSEWCEDDWHLYMGANSDGKPWIDSPRDSRRIHRGGSWQDEEVNCRVSTRHSESPWSRSSGIGFRLVLNAK